MAGSGSLRQFEEERRKRLCGRDQCARSPVVEMDVGILCIVVSSAHPFGPRFSNPKMAFDSDERVDNKGRRTLSVDSPF